MCKTNRQKRMQTARSERARLQQNVSILAVEIVLWMQISKK